MSQATQYLVGAADALRKGDFAAAYAQACEGLDALPHDAALLGLAALAALRLDRRDEAVQLLRRQLEVAPNDRAARFNLAHTLAGTGSHAEALALASEYADHAKLSRLAGYLYQEQEQWQLAIAAYAEAVRLTPEDWESWNNLGNCLVALGDRAGGIAAFENAINRSPGLSLPEIFHNLSRALDSTGDRDRRLHTAREAVRRFPDHLGARIELGLALAATGDMDRAEAELLRAAEQEEGFGEARLELGLLYENLNRLDELDAHVAACEGMGAADELNFLKAWSLRRRERFAEAGELADRIPPTINPIRTAQLRAEIAERLKQSDAAFRQFTLMNQASCAAHPAEPGPSYRQMIAAQTAAMTSPPPPVASDPDAQTDPVFIVGFPRSGTTLLDTLLTGLPELQVFEELPMLVRVEEQFPDIQSCTDPEVLRAARLRYFEIAEGLEGPAAGRRVVDKMPLHLTHMPIIHRLFPRAAIVLVERHPLDAVLSCYMANFTLNHAMRSFTELEEAARTYDAVFTNWNRAVELLPLSRHAVRYERMIADLETEMRALIDFLGLEWRDSVLDNQANAARRGLVRTASYAQIGQPLYSRAVGRWERYRKQLEPVIPILSAWIERMNYPL
jgi:tetratricopeptide (TPR) repeat protein